MHESQKSWEDFRDDELMPKMQAGIPGGFGTPSQETPVDFSTVVP